MLNEATDDGRKQRGLAIAATARITRKGMSTFSVLQTTLHAPGSKPNRWP